LFPDIDVSIRKEKYIGNIVKYICTGKIMVVLFLTDTEVLIILLITILLSIS